MIRSLDEYFSASVFRETEIVCGGSFHLTLERGMFSVQKYISHDNIAMHLRRGKTTLLYYIFTVDSTEKRTSDGSFETLS